jgi:hypothetical protein
MEKMNLEPFLRRERGNEAGFFQEKNQKFKP